MEKKKIIHVAQSAGGVAEYLYMLLKNLDSNDYENILIVSEDYQAQLERFRPYVKNIYIVPMIRNINLKSDIKAIFKVRKIMKKEKPDIAYLHSSKAGAIGRLALLFDFKVKILYNAHGWYFNAKISDKKKKFFAIIERILAFKTDKIINISKSEYASALRYKVASDKKMCIIENGIDFTKFKDSDKYKLETRKKLNIGDNQIVIGVVGRLSEQKDPMTSVKAFKKVKEEFPNTKLLFVGSGELEKNVMQYAKENNLKKDVIITGWVNDVEKYIPAFDIAILPSKWEGFGLVLIEYMACKKPIVASNVGGIKDIIQNGINGYLINIESKDELFRAIKRILLERNKTEEMIQTNLNYIKKYDIAGLVEKHKKIFAEK